MKVKRPVDFAFPAADAVAQRVNDLLKECGPQFADPRVTTVNYAKGTAKKTPESKKAGVADTKAEQTKKPRAARGAPAKKSAAAKSPAKKLASQRRATPAKLARGKAG